MAIAFYTDNIQFPKQFKKRQTTQWIKEFILGNGKKTGEITYVFCDDAFILELNRHYLQHTYYTDIITFDYSAGDKLSGDIIISLETVQSNAEKYKTDFANELRRVIIHGILHLCGYKDKTRAEKRIMREKENESLRFFADKFQTIPTKSIPNA